MPFDKAAVLADHVDAVRHEALDPIRISDVWMCQKPQLVIEARFDRTGADKARGNISEHSWAKAKTEPGTDGGRRTRD